MSGQPTMTHQSYTVGWICALPVEAAAARSMLDTRHPKLPRDEQDHNIYTLGRIGPHNIVITCLPASKLGTNMAAMVATQMHRSFTGIRFCLMVGIAGGAPSKDQDIRLGDVVVGLNVVQYDYGKTVQGGKFHQTGQTVKPTNFLLTIVGELQTRHMMEGIDVLGYLSKAFEAYPEMASSFADPGDAEDRLYEPDYDHPEGQDDCCLCDEKHLVNRSPRHSRQPRIFHGVVASGNKVMRHGATREILRKQMQVICFEMEAAGLYDIFPSCLVIRGVCDYSDSHKHKQWQPYASITAACYARELLLEIDGVQVQETDTMAGAAVHTPMPRVSHADRYDSPAALKLTRMTQPQTSSAASREFHETMMFLKTNLSEDQLASFRSVNVKRVQSSLMFIQDYHAKRFHAMDLSRMKKLLESIQSLGDRLKFDESNELTAILLGMILFSLKITQHTISAFDLIVKFFKTIGDFLPFNEPASAQTGDGHLEDLVIARMCDIVARLLVILLESLSVPALEQTFDCTFQASRTRRAHLYQALQEYGNFLERGVNPSTLEEHEWKRLHGMRALESSDEAEAKRRWNEIQLWLAGTDWLQTHQDVLEVRNQNPGSGTWLLKDSRYTAWRSDDVPQAPMLWLKGILGAGKTFLVAGVVENCRRDTSVSTALFYCHHADPRRTRFMPIMRTLLAQLLRIDHILLPWCYRQYVGSNQLALTDEKMCAELLRTILLCNHRTVVILDGLDECDGRSRALLLNFFKQAISDCEAAESGKLRILIASRDEDDIRKGLSAATQISVSHGYHEADIRRYIQRGCQKLREMFNDLDQDDIDCIIERTLDRTDGMFLFAKLVMTDLQAQLSLRALHERINLASFPRDLEDAYNRIISRIREDSNPEKVALARKVLGWMTIAKRPLKWHEIQGALSIDTGNGTAEFAQHRSPVHIRELCGSLINDLYGDRLELVHTSAIQYLVQSSFVQVVTAENRLASLCLSYLTFEFFEENVTEDRRISLLLQGSFAFQDYAAAHWSDHLSATIKAGPVSTDSDPTTAPDFGLAHEAFANHYQHEVLANTGSRETDEHCRQFEGLPYYNELAQTYALVRQQRAKGQHGLDEIIPRELKSPILSNRAALERFANTVESDRGVKEKLQEFYGRNWYKCPKAACYYFHEGFPNGKLRDYHLDRHEQPFRCENVDCETGYKLGFTTLKQLEKHRRTYHPEDMKIMATFARLKKAPEQRINSALKPESPNEHKNTASTARFACNLCPKKYTRRDKLNRHLQTHSEDNVQFECQADGCGKSFTSEDARKRHQKEAHLGEKRYTCVAELKFGIPGTNIVGCRKSFPRLATLVSHWNSKAGQACLKPLRDEEDRERQWLEQVARRKADGLELPLPRQLYSQFPELRKPTSAAEQAMGATDADNPSSTQPSPGRWQPFRRGQTPETTSSQGTPTRHDGSSFSRPDKAEVD